MPADQLPIIKVAKIKNFEVKKNTKHPYNNELPDCESGFQFWVRQLGFQFWVKPKSGNCCRFQFWAYPKVETADAFPVLGCFHFWACTIVDKYMQGKNFSETSRSRTVLSQGLSSAIRKLEKLITFVPRTRPYPTQVN